MRLTVSACKSEAIDSCGRDRRWNDNYCYDRRQPVEKKREVKSCRALKGDSVDERGSAIYIERQIETSWRRGCVEGPGARENNSCGSARADL